MLSSNPISEPASAPLVRRKQPFRRLIERSGLFLCALLLFRALGVEPYVVPTGSMAPALLGHHRATTCSRCGCPVTVGVVAPSDAQGSPDDTEPACPNCGWTDLHLDEVPISRGDHLLVHKHLFDLRPPRRWETAVFRCPTDPLRAFVKRVVGQPGETVLVRDGDVYIDHQLARKTLDEARATRLLVFDNNHQPRPQGWAVRWQTRPAGTEPTLDGPRLHLDALDTLDHYHWLVYRHTRETFDKDLPLLDEHGYNGGSDHPSEPVHDFLVECDIEIRGGSGWVAVGLSDGGSEMVAELPVGPRQDGTRLTEVEPGDDPARGTLYRNAPTFGLEPGRTYHVEMAFMDRRASLSVDGHEVLPAVDRPALPHRVSIAKPARLGSRGVEVVIHNFRLFRDVHYTSAGEHAVNTPLRLGGDQYFVLGDNSPFSDDSRFWSSPDGHPLPVSTADFLGKPFLVHRPARATVENGQVSQRLAWERIHWLR